MNQEIINKLRDVHQKQFGEIHLSVYSSGRINIIGEHVDYNDGYVLPASVNLGIYMTLSPREDRKAQAYALDLEEEFLMDLDALEKTENGSWANYLIGITALLVDHLDVGFNVCFSGDIPLGSGLSSSAALENALGFGLKSMFTIPISKLELAKISQKAEHEYVGVNCGIMDQYASMLGQKNHLLLLDCRSLQTQLIPLDLDGYEFVLFNSNVKHSLNDSAYNERRSRCEETVKILQDNGLKIHSLRDVSLSELEANKQKLTVDQFQKSAYVIREISRVQEAVKALDLGNLSRLGTLLNASHKGLSEVYEVSCEELDFLQETATSFPEVLGGRMMGGGFGGCTINLVKSNAKKEIIDRVLNQFKNKFNYEASVVEIDLSDGTYII